jgi:hypothetical protein
VEGILTSWIQGPRRTWYEEERRLLPPRTCLPAKHSRKVYVHFCANRKWRSYQQAFLRAVDEQSAALPVQSARGTLLAEQNREATLPLPIRFRRRVEEWERDTRFTSSLNDIVRHRSYQEIIEMGEPVVPLILNDLQKTGRFWFPALVQITRENPVDPADSGRINKMTKAWIKWGKQRGRI